jgi:hypothetical protein
MLFQLQHKVAQFRPNLALFLGHNSDIERTSRYMTRMVEKRTVPNDDYLLELVERTGLHPNVGANEARRRIRPHQEALLRWVYTTFVRQCRDRQIVPVFVYMPTVTELVEPWRVPDHDRIVANARDAGFKVIDLSGAYDGFTPAQLWIAENDGHPNALGNKLIAERLFPSLMEIAGVPVRASTNH